LDPLLEIPLRHIFLFATVGLNLSEDFIDLVGESIDGGDLPWLDLYLYYIKKAPPPPAAAERYFCL
jgi:hypothetical protein